MCKSGGQRTQFFVVLNRVCCGLMSLPIASGAQCSRLWTILGWQFSDAASRCVECHGDKQGKSLSSLTMSGSCNTVSVFKRWFKVAPLAIIWCVFFFHGGHHECRQQVATFAFATRGSNKSYHLQEQQGMCATVPIQCGFSWSTSTICGRNCRSLRKSRETA